MTTPTPFDKMTSDQQIDVYLSVLRAWSEAHRDLTNPSTPQVRSLTPRANKMARRLGSMAAVLIESNEGRAALERLLDLEDPYMTVVVAAVAARWGSQRGVSKLSELAERPDFVGFRAAAALQALC